MNGGSTEFDLVLDLCCDSHRRIVLAELAEEQRPLTVNDLTKTILEYDHQTPVTDVSEEVLTQIRLPLYHTHIPKLESAGVVEYDPDRELVEPTEQFDQIRPYLSEIVEIDPRLELPVEL